jgi:hypothetical protein
MGITVRENEIGININWFESNDNKGTIYLFVRKLLQSIMIL